MSEADHIDPGTWPQACGELRARLEHSFDELLQLAREAPAWLLLRIEAQGWTGLEVLEHVVLTDHFLLRLVDKIAVKTAKRVARDEPWPTGAPRFDHLEAIASREHRWPHPEHMTPKGDRSPEDLLVGLARDRDAALQQVERFPAGEGTLHRIRMSVVGDAGAQDDRLDLYQYLAVVELHARRHLGQLARLQRAWEAQS